MLNKLTILKISDIMTVIYKKADCIEIVLGYMDERTPALYIKAFHPDNPEDILCSWVCNLTDSELYTEQVAKELEEITWSEALYEMNRKTDDIVELRRLSEEECAEMFPWDRVKPL